MDNTNDKARSLSVTAQRNLLSTSIVEKLEDIMRAGGIEIYRTGDNLSTITFECGTINDKPVYGSIKFTLHKDGFDLDEKIEEYEMFLEEREIQQKQKEAKAAKALKDKEERAQRAAARAQAEERAKEKRREIIEAARHDS